MTEQTWIVLEFVLALLTLSDLCMASTGTEFVAAIDFGTTYSAYAFSLKTDFEQTPTDITMNEAWKNKYMKSPTTILFDEDKTFHSFGYDADKKFNELTEDNKHWTWYYFDGFKEMLHPTKDRKLNLQAYLQPEYVLPSDEHDRKMLAIDVFSNSIKYLADKAREQINKQAGTNNTKIKWVLTVPAIWDDVAKQFMRKAANYAGLFDDNLVLALEPEAASIYCRYLKIDKSGVQTSFLDSNSNYVLGDFGGGTADIVIESIIRNRFLKETHEPVGGDWGGRQVDRAYVKFLNNLFGEHIIRKLKKINFGEFDNMIKEFEDVKRSIHEEGEDRVDIKIPITLVLICEEEYNKSFGAFIKQTNYGNEIEWDHGSTTLKLQANLLRSLFSKSLDSINNALTNLLDKTSVTIVLVGGYAESAVLKKSISATFNDSRIITPQNASLATVKGAVLFGLNSSTILTRKCKETYGVSPAENNPIDSDGQRLSSGTFNKLAEKGESLKVGTSRNFSYVPLLNETHIHLKIYTSTSRNPKYVSERSCSFLGHVFIDGISPDFKAVTIQIILGDTELTVRALDPLSAKYFKATLNFLK